MAFRGGRYLCDSFAPGGWLPCAIAWDPETGRFARVEGPEAFATWGEAEEASRFLPLSMGHFSMS